MNTSTNATTKKIIRRIAAFSGHSNQLHNKHTYKHTQQSKSQLNHWSFQFVWLYAWCVDTYVCSNFLFCSEFQQHIEHSSLLDNLLHRHHYPNMPLYVWLFVSTTKLYNQLCNMRMWVCSTYQLEYIVQKQKQHQLIHRNLVLILDVWYLQTNIQTSISTQSTNQSNKSTYLFVHRGHQ